MPFWYIVFSVYSKRGGIRKGVLNYMKKYIEKVSKYTFYAGVLTAIYGLFKSFIDRRGLPPGACPIEDNRPIMYIGIALLIISIVLDFIDDHQKKEK